MKVMDIGQILSVLPHRYPMLLVDRILDVVPGKSVLALKNVTINEPFFQGHYPGLPVMPGVLIVEAMAQAGAVILLSEERFAGRVPLIAAIDNIRYKRMVVPGDQLIMSVELIWLKAGIGRIKANAKVENELAAEMEMTFKLAVKE